LKAFSAAAFGVIDHRKYEGTRVRASLRSSVSAQRNSSQRDNRLRLHSANMLVGTVERQRQQEQTRQE
jgi:hypothetical protein